MSKCVRRTHCPHFIADTTAKAAVQILNMSVKNAILI